MAQCGVSRRQFAQARALGEGQRPEQIEGRPFTDALGLVEFCEEVVERFAESVWKSQVNQIASVGGDCSLQQGIANDAGDKENAS